MAQDSVPIYVLTPSAQAKRRDTARAFTANRPTSFAPPSAPSRAELRGPLKEMRRWASSHLLELRNQLRETLASQHPDIRVWEVGDAQAATEAIAQIAGETSYVAVNKSGVVNNELRPSLLARGLKLVDTYYEQYQQAPAAAQHHWELPFWSDSRLEMSFASEEKSLSSRRPISNLVGLLGVNAISAEDGTVYFLEHFSNISDILGEASKIVLVVALDKVVRNREEAQLQTQGMALFGLDSVLLDLGTYKKDKTPYTLKDVKAAGELFQGTPEVHLLLLDNGRLKLAEGPYQQVLDCIGCRACLRQCPTYPYFGGTAKLNPKEYLTYFVNGQNPSMDLCTSCGMCLTECPVDIDIPFMIAQTRSQKRLTLQRWLLARAEWSSRLASWTAPLSNSMLRNPMVRLFMEKTVGIHRKRTMPTFQRNSLDRWFKRHHSPPGKRQVAYFGGCTARYSTPEVGRAVASILERNGLQVIFPPQRCSGMPSYANGDFKLFRRNAEFNLDVLGKLVDQGYDIVTSCVSCSLTLKHHYPKLIGERAKKVSQRVYTIEEYLLRLYDAGELDTNFKPVPANVSYHVPCHLKDQHADDAPIRLLNLIPELTATRMPGGCSGMSGTFGLKVQYYDKSMELGAHMFQEIEKPDVEIPSTSCPTCKMQMDHGSSKETVHPALLIERAYGEAP